MNVLVVSLDDQNILRLLRAMMVMVVVVVVVRIWEGSRGTATESDVVVHPVGLNVRFGSRSLLGRLLCWSCGRGAMLVRLMRLVMRGITPR